MKPQTGAFLAAADVALSEARIVLTAGLPRQAARLAYYTQFHAAQALIFERTNKVAKTHKGVGKVFHQLAQDEATFPSNLAAQLSDAYRFKEHADYSTDLSTPINSVVASDAIGAAESFVDIVRQVLELRPGPTPT